MLGTADARRYDQASGDAALRKPRPGLRSTAGTCYALLLIKGASLNVIHRTRAAILLLALSPLVAVAAPFTGNVYVVTDRQIGASVTLGGTIIPYRQVTLSAQIAGRIEHIAGEEGDAFQADDLLLAINDDDLVAKRRAAWAQLANADATLRNAGVQYSNEWNNPYSESDSTFGGMPSMMRPFVTPMRSFAGTTRPFQDRQAQLYSFGNRVEQARNSLIEARSRIEEIEAKLRNARSKAPFDGIIMNKLVEVGDTVQPGQPLLEYADISFLRIQVEVPARLLPGLDKGLVVSARLDVGNTATRARVAHIYPMADPDRHTVTVKFDLPRGTPGGPGMYAEVRIPNINAVAQVKPVIPYSALIWRGSLPAVYVVTDDKRQELRLVRIGEKLDEHYVTVLSGVRPGERIIANPDPGIVSGRTNPQP